MSPPLNSILNFARPTILLSLFILALPAQAFDFQIHGFGSLIGSKSNSLYSIGTIENSGDRLSVDPESVLGLNLSSALGEKVVFASQLVAPGNKDGEYDLRLIWMFLTYRPAEGWALRLGRQINPLFIYSEQLNVGFVTNWVRHPDEVYGLNPLDSFNGASLIYTSLFDNLELKTQIYGGAGNFSLGTFKGSLDDIKGVTIILSSDHFSIRTAYSSTHPHIVGTVQVPVSGTITGNLSTAPNAGNIQNFSIGGSFNWLNFIGSAETIRLTSTGDFVRSAFGAYGMLGYQISERITPYVMHAWNNNLSGVAYTFPDSAISTTPKLGQRSSMVGIGYKATSSLVVKGEYMRTNVDFLDTSKNFGANVFSLALDFVF